MVHFKLEINGDTNVEAPSIERKVKNFVRELESGEVTKRTRREVLILPAIIEIANDTEKEINSFADLLSQKDKEELKNLLLNFIKRVAGSNDTCNAEIAILPDIIKAII